MDFSDMEGQRHIAEILGEAVISGRAGHAYLFAGPEGIGKRTMAGIFARLLLCEKVCCPSGKAVNLHVSACGSCLPCKLAEAGTNPDYRVIRKIDSPSIGVESIRDFQADIIIKPVYSKHKVIIIEEADKMTEQAQNCLLKTLEEPPHYAVIILTAAGMDNLLETVVSRLSRFDFSRNTPEEVRHAIYRKFGKYSGKTDFIIAFSEGIIGTALRLEGSETFYGLREKSIETVVNLKTCKESAVFGMGKLFDDNKAEAETIFGIMISFYRDLLAAARFGKSGANRGRGCEPDGILINRDKKDIILDTCCSYGEGSLEESIRIITEIQERIRRNANFQLGISVMFMKLYAQGRGITGKGAAAYRW